MNLSTRFGQIDLEGSLDLDDRYRDTAVGNEITVNLKFGGRFDTGNEADVVDVEVGALPEQGVLNQNGVDDFAGGAVVVVLVEISGVFHVDNGFDDRDFVSVAEIDQGIEVIGVSVVFLLVHGFDLADVVETLDDKSLASFFFVFKGDGRSDTLDQNALARCIERPYKTENDKHQDDVDDATY